MLAAGVNNMQIYYAVGALAVVGLLTGGGKLVYDHSGDTSAKLVYTLNKHCQALRAQRSEGYNNCQINVDIATEGLMNKRIMDSTRCKADPTDEISALCPLKVWFTTRYITVRIPDVVDHVKSNKQGRSVPIKKRSVHPLEHQTVPLAQ